MASCRLNWLARVTGLAILAASVGRTASAQTDARLATVVKLAQDGLTDSARSVVKRLLATTPASDSAYAEMLYTSGLVAATDYERRIALRRVILEFAQSYWADDALLLLAQVEYANGNPGATVQQISRLLSDYPSSSLRAVGAFWGSRAAADMQDGATACRLADAGLTAPNGDLELKNQLEYQKQRCTALAAGANNQTTTTTPAPAETTKTVKSATPPPPPPPPPPAPVRGPAKGFRVQIVAAPTQDKADQAAASLRQASYDAVVVREGAFFKVRTQAFATRAEAQAALAKIRAKLGGQPFVVADK